MYLSGRRISRSRWYTKWWKKCSVKCGDLTQEKGQTVDSQCTCVKGAQQKDKRTCECKQTYKTYKETNECLCERTSIEIESNSETKCYPIIQCGAFTKEKDMKTAVSCNCIINAIPNGNNECKCKNGYTSNKTENTCVCNGIEIIQNNEKKCIQPKQCGIMTKEFGKCYSMECTCIDNAIIDKDNQCKCISNYEFDYQSNICKKKEENKNNTPQCPQNGSSKLYILLLLVSFILLI